MGIAYRCDAALGCTFIVWDGVVTSEDWRAREAEMFADPAFPPGPRALADLRTADPAGHISRSVIDEMARRLRVEAEAIGEVRMAVVPNSSWANARHFEEELGASPVRVISFTGLATACTWLGLELADARSVLDELRATLRR